VKRYYNVKLNGKLIGRSLLENDDAPMGVAFGNLEKLSGELNYSNIKEYCNINSIELAQDIEDEKTLITTNINDLVVLSPAGIEIACEGNQLLIAKNQEFEIIIQGIPYPFYQNEFPNLVEQYKSRINSLVEQQQLFKDFVLHENNHFVGMEYYNLIFNRTFLILILEDSLLGLKVNGLVSVESGGTIANLATKQLEKN